MLLPETRKPKPETRNPKPETRNPKPETRTETLTRAGFEAAGEVEEWVEFVITEPGRRQGGDCLVVIFRDDLAHLLFRSGIWPSG